MLPKSPAPSRTRQYLLWALVIALLSGAAILLISQLVGNEPKAIGDIQATIRVHCSACNETFDMPLDDYQAASPLGTDVSGPIDCPKCGGEACVKRVEMSGMPPVRPEGTNTNPDAPQADPDEYDEPMYPGAHVS